MRLKPCWSCGSEDSCYQDCMCRKCVDPEGYEEWKNNDVYDYNKWLESQEEE